jgi:hypothetical protein
MEELPTIDASAKLAKRELIERTCNAAFAAVIGAHRAHPLLLLSDDEKLNGDDLAEMWGPLESVPAPPQPVPRRQRKRSLATVLAAARKAGADRVVVDGAVIALSPAAAVPTESNGNAFDEWIARHANPTKGR